MKDVLKLSFAIALIFSMSLSSFAQSQDHKSNIYVGTGFSLLGGTINTAAKLLNAEGNISATPALQATFDYNVYEWLSIGGGISFQEASGQIVDYSFTIPVLDTVITESFGVDVSRLVIGIRALAHYNVGERIDLYSGIRINYKSINISSTSTNPIFDRDLLNIPNVGVQIIGIGVRYFVTENIGLSAETGFGGPHFLNVGLNFRM